MRTAAALHYIIRVLGKLKTYPAVECLGRLVYTGLLFALKNLVQSDFLPGSRTEVFCYYKDIDHLLQS